MSIALFCRTRILGSMMKLIDGLPLTTGLTRPHSLGSPSWGQNHVISLSFLSVPCFLTHLCVCINRKKKVLLVFDGVDTVSSIWLNGIAVGKTDNMFRRYVCLLKNEHNVLMSVYDLFDMPSIYAVKDFPVTDLLKDGENLLKVHILSPVLYAAERRKAHSAYRVPPECPPDVQKGECHVNFIRKVSTEQNPCWWNVVIVVFI